MIKDYACPRYKCNHNWLIIEGYYNPKPNGRKIGHCYCGEPFPK